MGGTELLSPYTREVVQAVFEKLILASSSSHSSDINEAYSSYGTVENYGLCPTEYGYAYYSVVFGYYHSYNVCGCNVRELVAKFGSLSIFIGLSAAWLAAFMVALALLNRPGSLILATSSQFVTSMRNLCSRRLRDVFLDARDAWRAVLFLFTELMLILARRTPLFGKSVRRLALRWRPCTTSSLTTGEPIWILSPGTSRTPAHRRSLAQIQIDYRVSAGGNSRVCKRRTLLPAYKASSQRLRQPAWRKWRTTYNPSSPSGRGDCLFLVIAKFLKAKWTPSKLRTALRLHAASFLVSGDRVLLGKSLAEHLSEHNVEPQWFLSRLDGHRPRWGNTLDVLVAADLFAMNFEVFDLSEHKIICRTLKHGPVRCIGYLKHHFVAGKIKSRADTRAKMYEARLLRRSILALARIVLLAGLACCILQSTWLTRMTCCLPIVTQVLVPQVLTPSPCTLDTCHHLVAPHQAVNATLFVAEGASRADMQQLMDNCSILLIHKTGLAAGTGAELLEAEADGLARPFLLSGADADGLADHTIANAHDLAIFLARHRAPYAPRSVPSLTGIPAYVSSASSSCSYPSIGSTFEECSSDSDPGDSTPRAVRILHLRGMLRWLASTPVAHDICSDFPLFHAWGNPLQMCGMEDDLRHGRIISHSEEPSDSDVWQIDDPAGDQGANMDLPHELVDTGSAHDSETGYDDYEVQRIDASRDRRICLLSSKLAAVAYGVPVEPDTALVGEGIDGSHCEILNPAELEQLLDLSMTSC
eukprot:6443764-Amphidinium_carterae.1